MSQILPLALRPRILSNLIGQSAVVEAIRKQVAKRLPHAWMFVGGTGTGKTTTALIVATALQCEHQGDDNWGDPCPDCRNADWSIHELNASKFSGVEEAEKIAALSRYAPAAGKYRVVILDEAQLLTNNAQNLLLKEFEDPPETTIWMIVTTAPNKILDTMKRRCKTATYRLKPLVPEGRSLLLKRALSHLNIQKGHDTAFPSEKFLEAANEAELSASDLLSAVEQVVSGTAVQEAIAGIDSSIDTMMLCRSVIQGNWPGVKEHLVKVQAEQARWVHASIAGYLKGCLNKGFNRDQNPAIAESLVELAARPLEDSLILIWLWGSLYKITRRLRK